MLKKLIINADDFGYSRGVNLGIIDAHKLGVLTSATFMSNMPGSEHAAALAKDTPDLGVGVHLVLTCGRPLLDSHRTIVDVNGNFRNLTFYQGAFTIDYDEVYAEWQAQIEKCLAYGLKPTHLDSHHHINSYGDMPQVFMALAKKYGLPVRNNMSEDMQTELKRREIKTTDLFSQIPESALRDDAALDRLFENCQSVEVMTHPAYLDKTLLVGSSFVFPRLDELEFLTDKRTVERIRSRKDFVLTTYRDI